MAIIRWLETDTNANIDISSVTILGTYIADADRMIFCDVIANQVAGGGDYILYLTRTIGGVAYTILPKTTMTAAVGETAISGQTIGVTVRSGDVLTAYIDGLAGDTLTPDVSVRWYEMTALQPTTPDRTLDVDAGGGAEVGAMQTAVITAGAFDTDSITADALAADALAEIADAVWDELIAGHLGAGTTGEKLNDTCCSLGSGPITFTYTVTDSGTGLPIEDVRVVCTSDIGGATVVAEDYTDVLGQVVFYLEAGDYYLWSFKTSYTFVNPDTEHVA